MFCVPSAVEEFDPIRFAPQETYSIMVIRDKIEKLRNKAVTTEGKRLLKLGVSIKYALLVITVL